MAKLVDALTQRDDFKSRTDLQVRILSWLLKLKIMNKQEFKETSFLLIAAIIVGMLAVLLFQFLN